MEGAWRHTDGSREGAAAGTHCSDCLRGASGGLGAAGGCGPTLDCGRGRPSQPYITILSPMSPNSVLLNSGAWLLGPDEGTNQCLFLLSNNHPHCAPGGPQVSQHSQLAAAWPVCQSNPAPYCRQSQTSRQKLDLGRSLRPARAGEAHPHPCLHGLDAPSSGNLPHLGPAPATLPSTTVNAE